jgi:predicted RNA binding protein YcfA (HicA-like mRNA interferase family)
VGRLAGFRYRDVARRLRSLGFSLRETGKGSHEVWINSETGRRTVLVNHAGDVPEGTLRAILALAGISLGDFLA